MTTERDRRNQDRYAREIAIAEGLAEGRAKGLAEGRAEGLAEGRAEGRAEGQLMGERAKALEIARNMLEANIAIAEISRLTGIDIAEIQKF